MTSQDAFKKVINVIDRMRKPGEKPKEDLYSMDKFVCDLCQGVKGREEITQCGFCGRWVCKDDEEDDCWNEEMKACESCSGVILLAKKGDQIDEKDLMDEKDQKESSDEGDEDE
ncbi:MAG: hypothetical protein ACOC55_01195 [Candidatus Natronoplasma sp.]